MSHPSFKPRALLIADVRGWAFCQNSREMAAYCASDFDFSIGYVRDWQEGKDPIPDFSSFDVIYSPYHRWGIDHLLPWDRVVGSLRARWTSPESKGTPSAKDIQMVNRYLAYHTVCRGSYEDLKPHCPNVVNMTNPVDMQRFPQASPKHDRVIFEWNGNAGHSNALNEDVKGFRSIITPARWETGVPLIFAEYETCKKAPHEMPAFYQDADVALCASLYEGASSSVLESMASGLAVIATDVGNHREMMEGQLEAYGETGIILVDRSVRSFTKAIGSLRNKPDQVKAMGAINRRDIEEHWSWSVWAPRFIEFLKKGLK